MANEAYQMAIAPAMSFVQRFRMCHDCLIDDLSPCEYAAANAAAQSWFESPGFGTLYAAATHALLTRSESEQAVIAFYKVDRYLGLFRKVQFVAPVRLSDEMLEQVMSRNSAHCVNIPLIRREFLDNNANGTLRQPDWKFARQAEDVVIQLPATMENYLSGLGKQTRKHLPYYVRRLEREWGSQVRFAHLACEEIKLCDFQRLVDLNRARMRRKGKGCGWTEDMVRKRWRLACSTGPLTGVYRDDNLVAGTICYLHRGEAFLALISHDPAYDRLNLGSVALYKAIEQAIAKGCIAFHLLWGRGFYKRQFGGEEQPLFEAVLFRRRYGSYLSYPVRAVRDSTRYVKEKIKPIAKKSRRFLVNAVHH